MLCDGLGMVTHRALAFDVDDEQGSVDASFAGLINALGVEVDDDAFAADADVAVEAAAFAEGRRAAAVVEEEEEGAMMFVFFMR